MTKMAADFIASQGTKGKQGRFAIVSAYRSLNLDYTEKENHFSDIFTAGWMSCGMFAKSLDGGPVKCLYGLSY